MGSAATVVVLAGGGADERRGGDAVPVRAKGPAVRIGNGEARTYVPFNPVDNRRRVPSHPSCGTLAKAQSAQREIREYGFGGPSLRALGAFLRTAGSGWSC